MNLRGSLGEGRPVRTVRSTALYRPSSPAPAHKFCVNMCAASILAQLVVSDIIMLISVTGMGISRIVPVHPPLSRLPSGEMRTGQSDRRKKKMVPNSLQSYSKCDGYLSRRDSA